MALSREKAIAKAVKLISLSSSPNEAEANAAAIRACELIREYQLQLAGDAIQREVEDLRQAVLQRNQMIAQLEHYLDQAEKAKPPPPPPPPKSPAQKVKVIQTKYDGYCKSCGGPFRIGDTISWFPGFGCWHVGCKTPANLEL